MGPAMRCRAQVGGKQQAGKNGPDAAFGCSQQDRRRAQNHQTVCCSKIVPLCAFTVFNDYRQLRIPLSLTKLHGCMATQYAHSSVCPVKFSPCATDGRRGCLQRHMTSGFARSTRSTGHNFRSSSRSRLSFQQRARRSREAMESCISDKRACCSGHRAPKPSFGGRPPTRYRISKRSKPCRGAVRPTTAKLAPLLLSYPARLVRSVLSMAASKLKRCPLASRAARRREQSSFSLLCMGDWETVISALTRSEGMGWPCSQAMTRAQLDKKMAEDKIKEEQLRKEAARSSAPSKPELFERLPSQVSPPPGLAHRFPLTTCP